MSGDMKTPIKSDAEDYEENLRHALNARARIRNATRKNNESLENAIRHAPDDRSVKLAHQMIEIQTVLKVASTALLTPSMRLDQAVFALQARLKILSNLLD